MAVPHTRYAIEDGVHVAYQVLGVGPPHIVFARDGVLPIDCVWDHPLAARFHRRLGERGQLVCFDPRGWGASDSLADSGVPPVLETWVDDISLLMRAVELERAVLIGCGEGGLVAAQYAATHPEKVSALVLVNAFARFLRDGDYPIGMPPDLVEKGLDRAESHWGRRSALEYWAPSLCGEPDAQSWWARCERAAASPASWRRLWSATVQRDIRSLLPSISAPTLVLQRAENGYVRAEQGEYLASHIPGAEYRELPGRDHLYFAGDDGVLDAIVEFVSGAPAARLPERQLATVLFTDIVRSTEELARVGDQRWRGLLDAHNEVVRHHLVRFRGKEVKTIGDGFLATFDGPARAVDCACAIRAGLQPLGLDTRAGIHTGEIEVTGDDIAGLAVHIAQRISALARVGEVFASRTVVELVAGSLIEFSPLGPQQLRGVPGNWDVYSVVAPSRLSSTPERRT